MSKRQPSLTKPGVRGFRQAREKVRRDLKAQGGSDGDPRSRRAVAIRPAAFPRERFLEFCSQLRVITKDFGLVQFNLLGTQTYLLDQICDGLARGVSTIVILKSRQIGASTFFIALDLFWAFEYAGLCGAFATHSDQSRDQFRNIIKTFSAYLPPAYKIPAHAENRTMLTLSNGSVFSYLVAGVKAKHTGSLGRSGAYNYLHATEVAFWGSEEDLKELSATLSTHYEHRLNIYETTANGFNHFADMWEDAKSLDTQLAIFVGWWRNELYRYEKDHPFYEVYMPQGEDEPLSRLEKRRIKDVFDQYGFSISREQLAWYRWKFVEGASRDQATMDAQYPWTEEDAFVASGAKYFSAGVLTDAIRRGRTIAYLPQRYQIGLKWQDTEVMGGTAKHHELKIFEEPKDGSIYVAGCDPAFGSSDEADRSVISVFRGYADKCVQVAEFASATISPHAVAWALAHLAGYYKNVLVILEISGPGQVVFRELNDLKTEMSLERGELHGVLAHMRHFLYRRQDAVMGSGLSWQWRMTRDLKWTIMGGMKDSFELQRAVINSSECLEEMRAITVKDGVIGAGHGKDDRVIAAALAVHGWKLKLQPNLIASGMTYARSLRPPTEEPTQTGLQVINYLRKAGVVR